MAQNYNYYGLIDWSNGGFSANYYATLSGITRQSNRAILANPISNHNLSVYWNLKGKWTRFNAIVGLNDECAFDGSISIWGYYDIHKGYANAMIFLDGVLAWKQGPIYQGSYLVDLDVRNVTNMTWVIDPLGTNLCDQIVFADAVLSLPTCFNILANNNNVCSGNGTCIGPDLCSCYSNYFGMTSVLLNHLLKY